MRSGFYFWWCFLALLSAHVLGVGNLIAGERDVAMITAVSGTVCTDSGKQECLLPFVGLKMGAVLTLGAQTQIKLLFYFDGKEEVWAGPGRLRVSTGGASSESALNLQNNLLPVRVARQMAKTPLDTESGLVLARTRAIATPDAIEKLNDEYERLRIQAPIDDLNPEIFLLASLLEMRQLEILESALSRMQLMYSKSMEVKVLVALYQKALRNIRNSGK